MREEIEKLSDEELEKQFQESIDIEERVELDKERIRRAKDILLNVKNGYDIEKFLNMFHWSTTYKDNVFHLVNEDYNIQNSQEVMVLLNKKLLVDAILAKTTDISGHNKLIENLNEKNLIIVNNILQHTTNSNSFTLSMQELKKFVSEPCLLTEKEIEALKGESKNDGTENTKQTNTRERESTDRQAPDRPSRMADRDRQWSRAYDSEDENTGRKYIDEYLQPPASADIIEDDSEVEE